jgi:transcriptional regulator with XRE-family HTH domain
MLKPSEVAERLNVSVKTLQRWDRDGILKAMRTPTNRRYYTEEQLDKLANNTNIDIEYSFLFYEVIMEYYDNNYEGGYEKADELIQANKNKGLYYISGENLVYKNVNIKEVAELFNVPEEIIMRGQMSFYEYLNGFDGGQYVEVLDTQIDCADCISYIKENMDKYIDRIYLAINNLKNDEECLGNEIDVIINEVVSMVAKEKIDEYIKELKDMSKTGKFNWK